MPGRRKIGKGQKSLEDVWQQARREKMLGRVKDSSALKKLFRCFRLGMAGVQTAKALGKSRQYVSVEVREAEGCGLIGKDGDGDWTLSPDLVEAMGNGGSRFYGEVHNFRMKFAWGGTTMDRLARDRRAGFQRVSPMRGGDRLVYWTWGRPEDPAVTIQVHPGSLLAYVANPGRVEAVDLGDVEEKIRDAIGHGVAEWARLQGVYGDPVEVTRKGRLVTEPHLCLLGSRDGPLSDHIGERIGSFWIDKSPAEHGDPEHVHLETKDRASFTALDRAINFTEDPEVREAMKVMPALAAHILGGASREAREAQERAFFMTMMRRMATQITNLEKKVNGE